jgi:mannosyltransferase OCH1-like enzyme
MSAPFPQGFEEDDGLRSEFIRQLARTSLRAHQLTKRPHAAGHIQAARGSSIPRTLVRFWHDSQRIPLDVQACLDSWTPLREEGVVFRMFDDETAATYIADRYGASQVAAFARCEHPAMRSDYLRLCFVLAEGGLYVDADDVLLDSGWRGVFRDNTLKVQPLCYDIPGAAMVAATEPGLFERPTRDRIFYINNNPIAAPPGHPVLRRALARATRMLLDRTRGSEIQSTTGPGNLTAALAAHAHENLIAARRLGVDLLFDWESTAKPEWNLGYRHDERNWRNWCFTRGDREVGDE